MERYIEWNMWWFLCGDDGKFSIGRQSWGSCISCSWLRSLWSMQMLLGSGCWTWGRRILEEFLEICSISQRLLSRSPSIVDDESQTLSKHCPGVFFFPIEFPFAWHEMQRHTHTELGVYFSKTIGKSVRPFAKQLASCNSFEQAQRTCETRGQTLLAPDLGVHKDDSNRMQCA